MAQLRRSTALFSPRAQGDEIPEAPGLFPSSPEPPKTNTDQSDTEATVTSAADPDSDLLTDSEAKPKAAAPNQQNAVKEAADATLDALITKSKLPERAPTQPEPSIRISDDNLNEAEFLLRKMNTEALHKLKRLLRAKATAVEKDLDLLTDNEKILADLAARLQEEKNGLETAKLEASSRLEQMRDNLCKVTNFPGKTFQLRGDAVLQDSMKNQWTEKGEMLEKMENMMEKGNEQDREATRKFEEGEKEWHRLILDYLNYEQRIVATHSRIEDLDTSIHSYENLVSQQETQLNELVLQHEEAGNLIPRHVANILLLRRKIQDPMTKNFAPENIRVLVKDFDEYTKKCDDEIMELKAVETQVEAIEDIRHHALGMLLEKCEKPGHRGMDDVIWADLVRSSIKASSSGLQAKLADFHDMASFKERVLREQMDENQELRSQAGLGLPGFEKPALPAVVARPGLTSPVSAEKKVGELAPEVKMVTDYWNIDY